MAEVLVLVMDGGGETQKARIEALRPRHAVRLLEPRWPACQAELREVFPAIVIVDGSRAPSHGRAVAKWMAMQSRFRTVPFLFLDVADRDVGRVKRQLPRAQFATWAGCSGAVERLVRQSDLPS
ncbi:MAG: hypothetical protein JW751_04955 [Polyangiaceae bacterium]|nr:hypothetical protein [Polyangiaceae bacterium]